MEELLDELPASPSYVHGQHMGEDDELLDELPASPSYVRGQQKKKEKKDGELKFEMPVVTEEELSKLSPFQRLRMEQQLERLRNAKTDWDKGQRGNIVHVDEVKHELSDEEDPPDEPPRLPQGDVLLELYLDQC